MAASSAAGWDSPWSRCPPGPGPVGLASTIGSRLFTPSLVVAVDIAPPRLEVAKLFGADIVVYSALQDHLQDRHGTTRASRAA